MIIIYIIFYILYFKFKLKLLVIDNKNNYNIKYFKY